jgi:uncharacterized protein with beta-barrel porin domain
MFFNCIDLVRIRIGSRYRKVLLAGTALAAAVLLPSGAQAQFFWGGATSDYNLGSNWTPSAGAPPVGNNQSAVFANSGSATVTVTAGTIAPDAWTFNSNAQSYVVTGAAVNFSGPGGVVNDASAGQAISISNNMTGGRLSNNMTGGRLIQAGNSTLTVSGTNSFGTTIVLGGTLVNSGSLTSTVDVNNGTSTFTNSNTVTGSVTNAGTFSTTGSVSNGITNNSGTVNASGTAAGPNANNGSGIWNVTGALLGNDTFTNSNTAKLNVTGGNFLGISTLTNNSTNAAGISIAAGNTLSAGGVTNSSGATIVNAGTLASLSSRVSNDGTLNTNTATSILNGGLNNTGTVNAKNQVNGVIANNATGMFTVTGALAGNGTFTNNGTAQLAVTGGDFTGIATLTNNSTNANGIVVAAARTLSATDVANAASAFIQNSGTLTATTGPITNSGTINNLLAGSIINGGLTNNNAAVVNAQGRINGPIIDNNTSVFTVTGGSLAGNSSFTNNGTAQLLVTGGNFTGITTLTNNSTSGIGISVSATRTLNANSLVNATGATINNLGTITTNSTIDNGAITGAYAMAGGSLSGAGSVQNLAVNGGIFAPGNGTPNSSMNVVTSLSFQAAAVFVVQINPTTASFANVTGGATLGGATVGANFAAGSYVSKQYTILTATGTVSGTFNPTVVNTNLPSNFHATLSYDAHDAFLNLALNFVPPPGSGLNGNQQNVGNAIVGFFNSTGSIPLVFGGLTAAGLTQAAGETATGTQQTTFDAMNQFMGVMTDPFIGGRGDAAASSPGATPFAEEGNASAYASNGRPRSKSERDAYAAIYRKAPLAQTYDPRWSVWAAGFGGSQTTDGTVALGSNNSTSRVFGMAAGADYVFSPSTIAGFALAGGGTNFSVVNGGSGHSGLFQAGAFVRHTVGPAYISGALAYGWQDITTDRTVTIAGVDRLRAQFNANAFSGRVEGGYRFVTPWIGGLGITPYAAGQFTTFDIPAYAEQVLSGANTFALAYGSKSVTATRSELGLRSDKSWAMQDAIFTMRGRAAWAHDYNTDRNIAATFQTLPGASFVVNGAAPAHDAALTIASAAM